MRNETLLEKLYEIRLGEYSIQDLIDETWENIKENKVIRVIYEGTQKGIILNFLQKNPNLKITASDFNNSKSILPFVGYSANSRLAELYNAGLLTKVGQRYGIKSKVRPMDIYKITEKGLKFKIRQKKKCLIFDRYFKDML